MIQCPKCGIQVTELHAIDEVIQAQLEAAGDTTTGPICLGCLSDLRKSLSQSRGGVLLAQERAKENHRLELWKNRVSLIKKARQLMSSKKYADAAITYEKYLKILEIIFNVKQGTFLSPTHFKDSAKTSEITIVTSVYWDLLRIYDIHEKYAERQQTAAKQLSVFIQYSPIYPDIIKRAEAFAKSAKNPQTIKSFLKLASKQSARCFIATSSFENQNHASVIYLRLFRDYFLNQSRAGRVFIKIYYHTSPFVAQILDNSLILRALTRFILSALIKFIRLIY